MNQRDDDMKNEHASTTGYRANASTTGNWAHASTTGDRANASTAGDWAHASTTGNWANASTAGYESHASTAGDGAHASTTGKWAHASTAGYESHASTTGDRANASTTGNWANASTAGYRANASTTGNWANASTTGDRAIAVAVGTASTGSCGPEGVLVLSWYDTTGRPRVAVGYAGETIEANKTYRLDDKGAFVEIVELLADDGRGYRLTYCDGRYQAGCRDFTAAEAIEHWSDPKHEAPGSAALLLAAVRGHEAELLG